MLHPYLEQFWDEQWKYWAWSYLSRNKHSRMVFQCMVIRRKWSIEDVQFIKTIFIHALVKIPWVLTSQIFQLSDTNKSAELLFLEHHRRWFGLLQHTLRNWMWLERDQHWCSELVELMSLPMVAEWAHHKLEVNIWYTLLHRYHTMQFLVSEAIPNVLN